MVKGQPKTTFELQATGTASTFGLIPPDHVYSRDTVLIGYPHLNQRGATSMKVHLGFPAMIERDGQQQLFTQRDCEEFFQAIAGEPLPKHSENLFQAIQRVNPQRATPVPSQALFPSIADQVRNVLGVLNNSPQHTTRPLQGFTPIASMLSVDLFMVQQRGDGGVYHTCHLTEWFTIVAGFGWLLVWLIGVWRIVRRRHWSRAAINDTSSTTAV
ncbi:MAG: hypothetical protein H7062_23875 [Candidatus Saccharimonas sp.]|nr:hypothetical protein [Planctomycetaceae bacterium]